MKRILILALGILIAAAVAAVVSAQTYEAALVAKERAAIDSIAAAVNAPAPVALSWLTMFTGIEMIAGHPTVTIRNHNHSTFPLTAGMNIDGAKAILLEFSWTKWVHGGFAAQAIYSASATDTGSASCVWAWNGSAYAPTWADTFSMDDSTAAFMTTPDSTGALNWRTSGKATVLLDHLPGAGYLFVRLYPHDYVIAVECKARKVE
jgi:hypothetical protein